MADLRNQKRLAAEILKCGVNRVWIDPTKEDDVAECITRSDIRTAIDSGAIKAKPKEGTSRGRIRHNEAQKAKGKKKGPGSHKGTLNARDPHKHKWVQTIRPIREELKQLRADGKISPSVYRLYYRRAKGGVYTSRRNLRQHMVTDGNLKEEEN
ncbi:MAG: 50S ribosomal protein L19e [Methanomethylophilus sp.]|jgi:large subunit ribosomal protein L19e